MTRRIHWLTWYLRALGTIDCLAVVVALIPHAWIAALHGQLGFGSFPADPITGYLARSASVMYALHGICVLYVSMDVQRYQGLIRLLACAALLHGMILVWVDFIEGMPMWWVVMEGPLFAASGLGALMLVGWNKQINASRNSDGF